MKPRTIFSLALVTAIVLGAAILLNRGSRDAGTPGAAQLTPLLPSLAGKADEICGIELAKGVQQVGLQRSDGAWTVQNKDGYAADFEKVRGLVRGAIDARILETKTSNPEFYKRLGVEDPGKESESVLLTFKDSKGQAFASVILGNVNNAPQTPSGPDPGTLRFARLPGDASALLIKGDMFSDADPLNWLSRTVAEIKNERVWKATVRHAAAGALPAEVYTVSRPDPKETKFTLEELPEGRRLKDDFAAWRTATAVSMLTFDDVRKATDADKATPEVESEFRCFDGLTIRAQTRTIEGRRWTTLAAAYEPTGSDQDAKAADTVKKEADDLNKRWSPWAYSIPDYKLTAMGGRREDLLAPVTPPAPASPTPPPG